MKKIILLLSSAFTLCAYAKTPKVDARITPYEYDERIAIGDHKPSLFNIANCKELYFAQDDNYYYLAVTFDASTTMNWAFILSLNSLDGGMTDPRPRMVGYGHSAKPNLMISGDFISTKSRPYKAYTSIGSFWSPPSIIRRGEACSNITSTNTNGCLEISIPKSFVTSIKRFDVQFYLSSEINKNSTVFDAIPDDTEAPAETENTILYNYARPYRPLPITLTYFNYANGLLAWATSNELNFSHFEVEKDGVLVGKTTSRNFKIRETGSYRLKMVDLDGSFTYSKYLFVSIGEAVNKIKILQNPIKNKLKISIDDNQKTFNINIISMEGKNVFIYAIKHLSGLSYYDIELPFLNAGAYKLLINNKPYTIIVI